MVYSFLRKERSFNYMGIKYTRKYRDINSDMAEAISKIENAYRFTEMEKSDWESMSETEKKDCIKTMCDDIFYVLGNGSDVSIGDGSVKYVKGKSIIEVYNNSTYCGSITLV
jgi:hypothetical protein